MLGNMNMKLGQSYWMILGICAVAGNEKWLGMIFFAEKVEHYVMYVSEGFVPPEHFVPVLSAYIYVFCHNLRGMWHVKVVSEVWKLCFLSKALLFLTTCIAEWLLIFSYRLDCKTDIYCVNHPGNHHPGLWHWSFSTDSLQSQAYYQTHNQPSKCWLLKTVPSLFPDLYLHISDLIPGEPSKHRWQTAVTLAAFAFIVITTDTLPLLSTLF